MSIEQYIGIAITTLLCGFLSIVFGYGGISKYKLFFRLCRLNGKWKKNWILISVFFLLISLYGVWLYGFSYEYISFMLIASYMVAITVTDLRSREIPDDATFFYGILFLIWTILSADISIIINGLAGAVTGAVIPLIVYFVQKDSIGIGDIKLLSCVGLLTGFPGVILVLLRAMVFGAIFSIGLLLLKKGTLKTELPFAPFVLLAALI